MEARWWEKSQKRLMLSNNLLNCAKMETSKENKRHVCTVPSSYEYRCVSFYTKFNLVQHCSRPPLRFISTQKIIFKSAHLTKKCTINMCVCGCLLICMSHELGFPEKMLQEMNRNSCLCVCKGLNSEIFPGWKAGWKEGEWGCGGEGVMSHK